MTSKCKHPARGYVKNAIPSARKVAILLAIGDREFTFGELSMI
jgi:hypothetical protein